jgi:anti-sigma factor RsiW
MTCVEAEPLLNAFLDGELDVTGSLGVERHLASCDACRALYGNLEKLREEIAASDLDWSAGANMDAMRARILRRAGRPSTGWQNAWRNPVILVAAAAAVLLAVVLPGRFAVKTAGVEREIVDDHIRSLMPDHLLDVPSSDQHTVKPWFQGRLGFSPPVIDLTPEGYPLIGGRLDVIGSRQTAAIVYKRHQHIINLLISATDSAGRGTEVSDVDGYHLLHWQGGGMAYWAVSDLNVAELRTFGDLIKARAQPR